MRWLTEVQWEMIHRGAQRPLARATDAQMAAFGSQMSDCHANAQRCVAVQPSWQIIRGCLVSGNGMVMKHSVVKTDEGVLLEITPKHSWTDWECASFRVW